jgi:O-antigen/teichoic acid export membrane protein
MSLDKMVAKGLLWESVTKMVIQIISWSSTIIVGRILSPEDYGVVAISGVYILLLSMFADMGLTWGMVNKQKISRKERDSVFWIGLTFGGALFVLVQLIASPLASLYDYEEFESIIRISSIMIPVASLRIIPYSMIMRALKFKFSAIVMTTSQFISVCVVLTLAYSGWGVWSLVYSGLAAQVVMTLMYICVMPKIPNFSFKIRLVKPVLEYGFKVLVSDVFAYANSRAGTFILGGLHGEVAVGHYSMSTTLAQVPVDKIGSIFGRVAFPVLSKCQTALAKGRRIFLLMHKYLVLISVPFYSFSYMKAEQLIELLLTEKWLGMVPYFKILLVYSFIRISYVMLPVVARSMGHPGYVIKANIVSLIITVISMLMGGYWGPLFAIFSWTASYPIVYFLLLKKVLSLLDITFKEFIRSWLLSVSMLLLSFGILIVIEASITFDNPLLDLIVSFSMMTLLVGVVVIVVEKARLLTVFRLVRG